MKPLAPALSVLALTMLAAVPAIAAGLAVHSGGVALQQRNYGAPLDCTLSAVADTWVGSDQSGSSFGSASTLRVRNSSTSTRRILLRFDLAGCSPAVAADALVHSATLRLTTATALEVGPQTYNVRRTSGSWNESTTWATQPTTVGTVTASATIPLGTLIGTTVDWAVTADVQSFVAGHADNLGWQLADAVEGVNPLSASALEFRSREASGRQPSLTIRYAP